MELLPPSDEREALLDRLAALIRAAGGDTFVAAPLVFADGQAFPDRYEPTLRGVRRLLRRVLAYAGMGELGVVLEVDQFASERVEVDYLGRRVVRESDGVAAWFDGIRGGSCRFGVDAGQLGDPEALLGVLAHEVAHAYRRYHDVEHVDHDEEERLTDLTTVYLGFGVLTVNAAQKHRSGGDTYAGWWRNSHAGYLGPVSMAFLLAAQVVARDHDGALRKQVARCLEINQGASFRAACDHLGNRDRVVERLGLSPPAAWPAPRSLPAVEPDDVVEPVVEVARDELRTVAPAVRRSHLRDADHVTFRVAMWRPRAAVVLASSAVGAAAVIALAALGHAVVGVAALVASALLGLRIGRRRHDECADPQCAAVLPSDVHRCPECQAAIAGRIEHRNQRLDAAEEYLSSVR